MIDLGIPAPDRWLTYDCHSKQGYLCIEWNLNQKTLNLASMVFNMYATTEEEYQWNIQSDEIEKFKEETINTRQIQLTQLNYVLLLTSSPSFFIPSPSIISR
jgi:hypothetical protein